MLAAGSIRIPAFFNGVCAHKPSPFVVSNEGHMPASNTDTAREYLVIGPMSRYADDLVPMLKAMAGSKAYELGLDEKVDLSYIKVYTVHELHFPLLTSTLVNSELMERQTEVCSFLEERFCATVRDAGIKSFQYSPFIWLAMLFHKNASSISAQLQQKGKKTETINSVVEILKSLLGYSKYHWATMSMLGIESLHQSFPGALSKFLKLGTQMR